MALQAGQAGMENLRNNRWKMVGDFGSDAYTKKSSIINEQEREKSGEPITLVSRILFSQWQ
jgi:hypothetical protein